ncbi:acyl-CoA thioesterase [Kitasatospora sp. NBC_01560]|uniref:acyl-CoA thioesterase n=1 Tax=Kitasatospora sp. NBC_01560 TaxID=2975965 RepID=UPI003865963B
MLHDETRLRLPVRPNDLDALGHVNNAVVLEYLEAGRWAWLAAHGIDPDHRVIAVVARAEIDYRAEIPRGEIELRTRLDAPGPAELEDADLVYRARFDQRLYLPGSTEPAAEAKITVAFLDAELRCLVTLHDFLASAKEPVR